MKAFGFEVSILNSMNSRKPRANDFVIGDLRDAAFCRQIIDRRFDEVYQLAADMGGAGYIFTGENDADIMHNSSTINLNLLDACHRRNIKRIFYSSSACMYPASGFAGPVNIGSEEMVTINELARVVMDISGKRLEVEHKPGPTGVRGRNSNNHLIKERLGWAPSQPLRTGLEHTYAWIESQVLRNAA
jgi:nucleoside-diphosphate-sugar epimerase